MEQESAQNKASLFLNSEPANEANLIANKNTLVNPKNNTEGREIMLLHICFSDAKKCPEAIRKQKWLAQSCPDHFKTPKRAVPTDLLFLEPMLV